MKILVVDDTPEQLAAAKEQLADHELTLVSTYAEARSLLYGPKPFRQVKSYDFDVILTDYMMLSDRDGIGTNADQFEGQLMPYGLVLALVALSTSETVKVAVVSAGLDHHAHPMVWAADPLSKVKLIGRLTLYVGYNGASPMIEKDKVWVKDWAAVLKEIMEKSE